MPATLQRINNIKYSILCVINNWAIYFYVNIYNMRSLPCPPLHGTPKIQHPRHFAHFYCASAFTHQYSSADTAILSIRPSIRPSHSSIVSKRLNISLYFLQRMVSQLCEIPTWSCPMGASNISGVWKNHDFQPMSHFISEMIQDRAIVAMGCK